MNEDRLTGAGRKISGKAGEDIGRVMGDLTEQMRDKFDQGASTAQNLYGQSADLAKDTAATFAKWLRGTIETKPYVAAADAVGTGWLIGRTHRPL
jgi:uncharacterized protein YjbJ (UPF0337 family)